MPTIKEVRSSDGNDGSSRLQHTCRWSNSPVEDSAVKALNDHPGLQFRVNFRLGTVNTPQCQPLPPLLLPGGSLTGRFIDRAVALLLLMDAPRLRPQRQQLLRQPPGPKCTLPFATNSNAVMHPDDA